MKKLAVPTILKGLLQRAGVSVQRALFRYMVKTGAVLCAVPDDDQPTQTETEPVQTGEDTGAATGDDQQAQGGAAAAPEGVDTGADDDVVISIEGEAPAQEEDETQQAPAWVKDLRKANREKDKRIRELEQKLSSSTPAEQAVKVGEKPTLESCEYDESRYETALTTWHETKRQADEQAAKQRKEQEDAQAAWQERLSTYQTSKTALKVQDFEDAEAAVLAVLNQTQHGIIVHGAERAAHLVYALGKNPAKLKELASIKDPVKYAFAVAKLETKLTVTPRKVAPAPERVVGGSAGGATGMDNTLARLEAEADRTGDRSKVIAYKRQQRRGQS